VPLIALQHLREAVEELEQRLDEALRSSVGVDAELPIEIERELLDVTLKIVEIERRIAKGRRGLLPGGTGGELGR
jgi:hypothetical protein